MSNHKFSIQFAWLFLLATLSTLLFQSDAIKMPGDAILASLAFAKTLTVIE